MIGKTVGHYQITGQLGKGGMGEVYRARDEKLGRDVAIKMLPEEFARDPDRVARFQREAKLLASLNHTNIAAIYGLEESSGMQFLVLELVEGETLADRLKRGPIPVEESLKLALQIAEALETAHEKGIIHRDLKPANIKVTPEGKVKVLDFGLAKAFAGEQADLNLSNSPTLSNIATMQGMILGTAAYMSPEQARGKAVDKRTDIWAFGCVLFEMLTGNAAFSGNDVTDVLAAVIRSEPDWEKVPVRVRPVLRRCLQKDPDKRLRDIRDVKLELEEILKNPSEVPVAPAPALKPPAKLRLMLPWLVVAGILCAIIAGFAVWKFTPTEPPQIVRFDFELPEGQEFSDIRYQALAVSADGKQFAYSTPKGIYLRSVNELSSKLIAGTEEDTRQPFFSPDDKWIGYFSVSDRKLKKIAVNGGMAVPLCTVSDFIGANWYESNTIVYGQNPQGILRVSANGGTPELLVKAAPQEILGRPSMMPDGKSVLFADFGGSGRIMVYSLESGKCKELLSGTSGADYLPTGHIVYGIGSDLFAIPFDPDKLETGGERIPLIQGVYQRQYSISRTGALVYILPTNLNAPSERTLVWVDGNGKEDPLGVEPKVYRYPRISPDGTRLAFSLSNANNGDVWIFDLARKALRRLTFGEKNDIRPIWTADAKRIVFCSDRNGNLEVYWKAADGTGKEEKLASAPDRDLIPHSWSSDGKTLVINEMVGSNLRWDVGVMPMEGDRTLKPLLNAPYYEIQPRVSPDGRYIAYTSNESTIDEIYVNPFPEVNKGKWQISTGGGDSPLWSPDGRELYYLNGDSVMAVAVETRPAFTPFTPKPLFRGKYVDADADSSCPWDIHPQSKRFLMMKELAPAAASQAGVPRKIIIVLNWFEELKQRVQKK